MEHNTLTFENLPAAVSQIIRDIADIKIILLNHNASFAEDFVSSHPDTQFLTVNDLSKKIGMATGTIYNLISRKEIPCCKVGGKIYFENEEIENWIKSGRRKTIREIRQEADQAVEKNRKKPVEP